jgi:uncharacterized protein (TIGR03435 family)
MRPAIFLAVVTVAGVVSAQTPAPAFEVASIKPNTAALIGGTTGTIQNTPKGEIRLVRVAARLLVLRAYPVETVPAQVIGLPSWADSERYDVTVRHRPDATVDEVREMWRKLLAERMKLVAHYEPRDVRGYRLVLARPDRQLGPDLKPSTLDCPAPDRTKPPTGPPQAATDAIRSGVATAETERLLMSQCRSTFQVGNTIYAGAVNRAGLVTALRIGGIREPIDDQTGLEGLYSFKLTFSRDPLSAKEPGAAPSLDAPSLFSAVQEQLGLKLEPTTIPSQAVVVDQIQRPTED